LKGLFYLIIDKTLNDMVPQLIPRDPVNIDGIKVGFNSIRSNIHYNIDGEFDPTNDAPIAVFDGTKKSLYFLLFFILF
jgi:hypothetical protein